MKRNNLQELQLLFYSCVIISAVMARKLVYTGIPLFGTVIALPGSFICYSFTFFISQIIDENYGKEYAKKTLILGFIGSVFSSLMILLVRVLPAAENDVQDAYKLLLGQNALLVGSSIVAYFLSQYFSIWMFNKFTRLRYINIILGQLLDTVVYIVLAFGLSLQYFFKGQFSLVYAMIVGQYVFKLLLTAIEILIFESWKRKSS